MHNFWTLVGFEYKKLLMKKMVWITLLILLGISVFMPMSSILGTTVEDESGTHSGLSIYESMKERINADIAISGRPMDEVMFSKYRDSGKRSTDTFSSIIYRITDSFDISNLTAEQMYQIRSGNLQTDQKESYLTNREMKYWEKQEASITKPFTYQYCSGYRCMISMFYTLVMSQVLLCAIGVSNIFAEEHTQKTDQLNLCTALGRKKLFYAKTFVGITFSFGSTMLMLLMSGIPNFIIYGTEGFDAQIQMFFPNCSYNLTAGNVMCIMLGITLLASVLHAVIAMLLSERFRSGMIGMAAMVGFLMLTLAFSIPEQFRVVSQIWNGIPSNMASIYNFLDARLIPIGNGFLQQWQVVPVAYLVVAGLAAWACSRIYRKYQVGR